MVGSVVFTEIGRLLSAEDISANSVSSLAVIASGLNCLKGKDRVLDLGQACGSALDWVAKRRTEKEEQFLYAW